MGKRGPQPGSGGRPRKSDPTPMLDGYVRITVGPPGKGKRVLQHRWVAAQAWGPGDQECKWCGRPVTWNKSWPDADALIVDHLDGDHANNVIENLVPSCGECNARRSANS